MRTSVLLGASLGPAFILLYATRNATDAPAPAPSPMCAMNNICSVFVMN